MKQFILLLASLSCASLQARNTEIIHNVASEIGHNVLVAETISKGRKTTLISLGFENKVCIKDIIMFDGPNDNLFLKWKSGIILEVKISGDIKIKSALKEKYLECWDQKIEIILDAKANA